MTAATPLLSRRSVVQGQMEVNYNDAAAVGVNDGILVMNPMYSVEPNILTRDLMRNDLSPLAHIIGRKLAKMRFKTEIRGNGKEQSGLLSDVPLLTRLFRACGYAMTLLPAVDINGVYGIGDQPNEVTWVRSSGASATGTVTYTTQPANGDTVVINGRTYTFRTVLTNVNGYVFIGATLAATLINLRDAINLAGLPGSQYANLTTANLDVTATATGTVLTLTSITHSAAANADTLAVTGVAGTASGATLSGGSNLAATNDVVSYLIECTVAGASGVAKLKVTADPASESLAEVVVTSGSPFTVGTLGLTLTPTWTGNLTLGQAFQVWLLPKGVRLDPVSDNFESMNLVLNKDGVLHKMPGSFGTFQVTAEAGQFASIDWEFTGTYVAPVDSVLARPMFEKTLPAQVELARLRVDAFYAIVAKFTFDQGNDIQIRPDVSSSDGYIGTRIVARMPKGGIDPESELVANQDFWSKFTVSKRMPLQMRVGTISGNTVWFMAPATQYNGLTYADRNQIVTYDAGLHFSRVNGNDEICIFFC